MTGKVWFTNVMSNYLIGNKLGLRDKYFNEAWQPAQHEVIRPSANVLAAMEKHIRGYALEREDFPEATAIFDQKCFQRVGDIFVVGPFYAVKERLADVFSRFNLGDGGLVPFTIYSEDLKTPIEGRFYYLNFGARKRAIIPSESRNVELIVSNAATGVEIWDVNFWAKDGDIALSASALSGPDLWVEEIAPSALFMSEALVAALREATLDAVFDFKECRIVQDRQ